MRKPMIPTLVLLATAGLVALTGCTPTAGPGAEEEPSTSTSQAPETEESSAAPEPATGEQTVEESCAIAEETMSTLQTEMTDAMSTMSSGDLTGVVAALESFETRLGDAVDQITNPEVDAALSDFQTKFASFNDLLASAQGGGIESIDQTALQTAATDIQTSAEEVQALCS